MKRHSHYPHNISFSEFLCFSRVLFMLYFVGWSQSSAWAQTSNSAYAQPPILQLASTSVGDTVSELGQNIDCMLQARNGDYWLGSNGEGVYRYDGKNLVHFTDRSGLCSNFIMNIQEDRQGILWFSTREGFCRYNGKGFIDYTNYITNAPYGKLPALRDGLFFGHHNGDRKSTRLNSSHT
mgnify:CR=1 FL=1